MKASEWATQLLLAGEGNEWAAPLLAKWADTVADLSTCERERDEEKHARLDAEFERDTIARVESERRRKAEAERDEYKRDASVMSATQCTHDMKGDDYGNAVCPLEAEVKALREELDDYRAYYEYKTCRGYGKDLKVSEFYASVARIEARRRPCK